MREEVIPVDWRLFATTFATILAAELGNKTQLATFAFATGGSSRVAVFLGASAALVCASAIAVVAAEIVGRFIPPGWLERGAGVLFILLGVFFLFGRNGNG